MSENPINSKQREFPVDLYMCPACGKLYAFVRKPPDGKPALNKNANHTICGYCASTTLTLVEAEMCGLILPDIQQQTRPELIADQDNMGITSAADWYGKLQSGSMPGLQEPDLD